MTADTLDIEIVDLEYLLDDTLRCVSCGGDAAFRSRMRCCPNVAAICGVCVVEARLRFADRGARKVRCGHCHAVSAVAATFDDVAIVVPV